MARTRRCTLVLVLVLLEAVLVLGHPREAVISAEPPTQDVGQQQKATTLNHRPIVGILSQELPKSLRRAFGNHTSYLAASYVKYFESAGARVVPIRAGPQLTQRTSNKPLDQINQPRSYYRRMFRYLNGLVFPGGSAKLDVSGYGRAARVLWDIAEANKEDFFPIWGTCLGFELLTFLELKERKLDRCSSQNQALPLEFTPDGTSSRMFSGVGQPLLKVFSTQNVTINFHKYCVSLETYGGTSLERDYRLISTNRDWNDQVFVSAFEHRTRPVYGVQFHPEKNIFEWGEKASINAIPHWPDAVAASQYLANFFVSEVRKNGHRFPSANEEHKHLIYNFQPVYSGLTGSVFAECYLFD